MPTPRLDLVKRALKLKRTLLVNKVHEYEAMEKEYRRLGECLLDRASFITRLNEEITHLEGVRKSLSPSGLGAMD